MGLTNASQQFQQLLEDRLQPVRDVADPYIDDIIVGTRVGPGEDLFGMKKWYTKSSYFSGALHKLLSSP